MNTQSTKHAYIPPNIFQPTKGVLPPSKGRLAPIAGQEGQNIFIFIFFIQAKMFLLMVCSLYLFIGQIDMNVYAKSHVDNMFK